MADTADDKLVKKGPGASDPIGPDPITRRSTSTILLVCALLLTGVLVWALWDEVYGQRPWKEYQASFAKRYDRYLKRLQRRGFESEAEVRERPQYQELDQKAREAEAAIQPDVREIDRKVAYIDSRLAVISDNFQDRRGRITVKNYEIETAHDDADKAELRKEAQEMRAVKTRFELPTETGAREEREYNYEELEAHYNELKTQKAALLAEKGEKLRPIAELRRERDEYLKNNVSGVTRDQVEKLIAKNQNFEVKMRQINIQGDEIVDRCETCHVGIREPIEIDAGDMMPVQRSNRPDQLARAFASHPSRELLQIHDPEKFGCASCHGGNGRATTNITKGHGRHRFWLHPLYDRENIEAGCQQCHAQDRVLVGASILNKGKDLFSERGCVGCHRYEGFDRETDSLTNARQEMKQLEEQIAGNQRESLFAQAKRDEPGLSDEENQRLLARIEGLSVTNSQIEARIDQLAVQSRYLMQDQKKVGPNLKDVRVKLRKEWIPVWLKDPQAFRPGTKMPTYWYISGDPKYNIPVARQEEERKAIAAYLWQSAFDGRLPQQPAGNAAQGRMLFEQRGCLACHSIGEGDSVVGGEFAANLQKVGEKANYEYIVRWVHNPRERTAPFCPKHGDLKTEDFQTRFDDFLKRGLITRVQYDRRDLTAVANSTHSKCPIGGEEMQVQNMTVMPNFRLTEQDSRDIATYLMSLSPAPQYPEASFMDDPALKEKGHQLIKQYGCAGCHEIRGFEEEQRIGKELTNEGATPLERLDFALLTHAAEDGHDPLNLRPEKKDEPWYNHKGFFEHKIADPSIYDQGKEKEPQDHLRMPKPFMKDEWRVALTTFLLGSKGVEGANVPTSFFYSPNSQQRDIQEGWWVIKKYNCMGCHSVQVGQERPAITTLPWYREGGELGKEQWPPGLLTEGARVDPAWLLRFLSDPSLSGAAEEGLTATAHGGPTGAAAQSPPPAAPNGARPPSGGGGAAPALSQQVGEARNGVRRNLKVLMPTFSFSPNERRTLVRFFMAYAAQQEPYIKERMDPLTSDEVNVARALFTAGDTPCLKCHLTGDPVHDATAYAPNFLDASTRLKPDWTRRWILDPQKIMPDTTMPGGLFEMKDGRFILRGRMPEAAAGYTGDHAQLLTRYILQLTPQEQNVLAAMESAAQARGAAAARTPAPAATPVPIAAAHWQRRRTTPPAAVVVQPARDRRAGGGRGRNGGRREVSRRGSGPPRRGGARPPRVAALGRARAAGFSP